MDYTALLHLAQRPLKQLPNRVWRTYTGGALIDQWKFGTTQEDGSFPEEWIMSTISARGKNRPTEEGLSRLVLPTGEITLNDLIIQNKGLFLGDKIARKFGTTGVLIKMLDSKERLTIQVHPDKEYARSMLHSNFGKTESWYILGGREMDGVKSAVYLGFKQGITPEIWGELFKKQDIAGMLNCLHRFDVQPGDAFMIYGGVPHAIGSGCFLLEVQEPTDYTMRVEKVTPGGLIIGDELIHQGVGEENMLKCFHYDGCSFEEATNRWKISPKTLESTDTYTLKTIFNKFHTDCFGLNELNLNGAFELKGNGTFFVAVIYAGEGIITCGGVDYPFKQGDEIFFSAVVGKIQWKSNTPSKVLLCYPPNV
ncbi:MAG: class I mannose-6-phosphate isomerase [Bacteroidia bacterium]|nr:class I mannose-6-phosphate isomerase [Bacteroidia bacterium]